MKITDSRFTIPGGLLMAAAGGFSCVLSGLPASASWTVFVTLLCAIWWMTEALPLPATALLPLAIFPLVGVLTPSDVANAYGNAMILLFLGGFILSRGMESSGAHLRIALEMMHLFGGSGRRLVFGFMAASALLSMWISNTATALMLLPVALAVVRGAQNPRLAVALLLAVAYGASIGGLGTPIGSPPNLVFLKVFEESTGTAIGFVQWMGFGLPVVVLFLPLAAVWLSRHVRGQDQVTLPQPGAWTVAERRVLLVFGFTALGWITRTDPFGGWSQWLGLPGANDASVALLGAVLLFVLPNGRGERLLDWESAVALPWGMLVLFGGGIAIAKAFTASGLSDALGAGFAGLTHLPVLLMVILVAAMVTMLTELNSNTATAVLLLPILAAAALAMDVDPLLLMLPATLSASCAFMLPVATPPNAIVFGSGHVPIQVMVREGMVLNLLGLIIIAAICTLRFG